MTKIIGIIPARYASTRFPGKPLVDIGGKTMIQRVYEQCQKSKSLYKTYVATDDQRIFQHVEGFGGNVVMTSETHKTGTDRCNEAASIIEKEDKTEIDVLINIQGDEPFIHIEQINLIANCFNNKDTEIASLAREISTDEDIHNPNMVKVVRNLKKQALYFSRFPIPFYRNSDESKQKILKHIGIYGYKRNVLSEISKLSTSKLEEAESLEQLRWLENGYKITLELTTHESISIDTKEDLLQIK
jgi:3-deoxy-manno-octulosonate cytidylyltransferase (CMP-KDO synthetase)